MNAQIEEVLEMDRRTYIGGRQSKKNPALNEGVVRHLYNSGMTVIEISKEIGASYRGLWFFMNACGIKRRKAIKRDQRGEKNPYWRGDDITYKSAHGRVYALRGSPKKCEHCGTSDPRKNYDWASVTGNYPDPHDYIRLCRSCHCKYDGLIKNLGTYAKVPKHAIS